MKNIIILGDSFTFGEGCSDCTRETLNKFGPRAPSEYCWPSLLKKELPEYNIINLAVPGNSLAGCFIDILKFKENVPQIHIDMVIMSVTSRNRMLITSPADPDSITNWVLGSKTPHRGPDAYEEAKDSYLKHLVNFDIIDYNAVMQLMALKHYCQFVCGVPLFWSIAEPHVLMRYKKGNWSDSMDTMLGNMYGFSYHKQKVTPEFASMHLTDDGHPNNLGHEDYFQNYIKPIVIPKINQYMKMYSDPEVT